jgi:hypothetical protein
LSTQLSSVNKEQLDKFKGALKEQFEKVAFILEIILIIL